MFKKTLFVVTSYLSIASFGVSANADCNQSQIIDKQECATLVKILDLLPDSEPVPVEPCDVRGIRCHAGHVTQVFLRERGLTGELPPLTGLSFVEKFDVLKNDLTGKFDASPLISATQIGASQNRFTEIEPDLAHLTKLEYFHAAWNEIEEAIANFRFAPSLIRIAMAHNNFYGPLPVWDNMPNLNKITIGDNNYKGMNIPENFIDGMPSLTYLSFVKSELCGEVPESILSANLEKLVLQGNNFGESCDTHHTLKIGKIGNSTGEFYVYNKTISRYLPACRKGCESMTYDIQEGDELRLMTSGHPPFVGWHLDCSSNSLVCERHTSSRTVGLTIDKEGMEVFAEFE